jgi:O-antigen/teichoic acid export membrane protein
VESQANKELDAQSQFEISGNLRRAAARGAGVAAVSYLGVQVLTFLTYVILARLAAPAVFGTFAAGSILLGVGGLVSVTGMSAAIVQQRTNVEAAAATALVSTSVGGVLLALAALALSPVVGLFFSSHEIGLVSAALSGELILNGLAGVPGALLQKRLALRRWIVDPFAIVAFGAVSAAGLASGLGVWGLVSGLYASSLTRTCGYWIAVRWRPDPRLVSFSMWRSLVSFARHIIASEFLREFMNVSTTALMGRYLGRASLGEFRFGWRLVTQATAPAMIGNTYTLQPALVRLAGEPSRKAAAALSSFRLVAIVAFPLGALFIPFGESLAVLLFGEAWRGCGPIMIALTPMAIALPMESIGSEIFKASRRPDILPRMHAIWAGTSIVLIAAFVHLGAVAVSVAWSISTVLTALYALSRVPQVLSIESRELIRAILPPLLSSLSTAVAILLFNRHVLHASANEDIETWLRLILELVIGGAVYFAALTIFASDALRELRQTTRMMFRQETPEQPSHIEPA